jgi:hypothetical protein
MRKTIGKLCVLMVLGFLVSHVTACDIDWNLSTCTVDSHCLIDEMCSSGFCHPQTNLCLAHTDCQKGANCNTTRQCALPFNPNEAPGTLK